MNIKFLIGITMIPILIGLSACENAAKQKVSSCFPAEKLPEYITPLTSFGERSEWSHDGKTVYFVDKSEVMFGR
ncbi:MAG: hypothetical protein WCP08_12965 [Prolixibacteraceae bacterium]